MLIRPSRGLRQNPAPTEEEWEAVKRSWAARWGGSPGVPSKPVREVYDPGLLLAQTAVRARYQAARDRPTPPPGLLVTQLAARSASAQRIEQLRAERDAARRADFAERMERARAEEERGRREAYERFKRIDEAREAAEKEIIPSNSVVVRALARLKLVGADAGRVYITGMIVPVRLIFTFDEDRYAWSLEDMKVSGRRVPAYKVEVNRVESQSDRLLKKELFIIAPTHLGVVELTVRDDNVKRLFTDYGDDVKEYEEIVSALPPSDAYNKAIEDLDIVSARIAVERTQSLVDLLALAEEHDLPIERKDPTPEYVRQVLVAAAVFTIAIDTGEYKQARAALQNMTGKQLISVGLSTGLYDPEEDGPMTVSDLRAYLLSEVPNMVEQSAREPTPSTLEPLQVLPGTPSDAVAKLDAALTPPANIATGQTPTPVVVPVEATDAAPVAAPPPPAPAAPAAPVALSVDVYGIYRAKGQSGLMKVLGKMYGNELRPLANALIPGGVSTSKAPELTQLIIEHVKRTA